jgi:hypothetical protein
MRMKTLRILAVAAMLLALLMGCAAPRQPLNTASGHPEILIANVSKKQVIDRIVASKLEKGVKIKSITDYAVIVAGKVDSFWARFAYGSRYDPTPEARITYTVVETGTGVKVFSRAEMVTNPGSGFERVSDATAQVASELQAELETLPAALAR